MDEDLGKWALGVVCAALFAFCAWVLFLGGSMVVGREFAKFGEETRRQVIEESRAYNEGMAQNLDALCVEWGDTNNPAIAQSIRHRVSGYEGELPRHIQECVNAARKVN